MCTVHSLEIHLRIPITIIQHNDVCTHQVKTKTTSTSRNQEDVHGTVWLHELLNLLLTIFKTGVSIKTTICKLPEVAKVFQNVKHRSESRENQHLVVVLFCLLAKSVKEDHFAWGFDDVFTELGRIFWLLIIKEIRVVANFSQLNENIFVVGHWVSFF